MEETFWLLWKAAPPILGIAVLYLLVERHQREAKVKALAAQKSYLYGKLRDANDEAHKLRQRVIDVRRTVDDLQQVSACANCAQVEALHQRNNQLVLANLAANCKLVLHSIN